MTVIRLLDGSRLRRHSWIGWGTLLLVMAFLSGCTTSTPTSTATSAIENTEGPASKSTARPIEEQAEGPILFIPLEGVDKKVVKSLAAHFEKKLKLDIEVLQTKGGAPEDFGAKEALDAQRKQLRGADFLERVIPYTEPDFQNPALPGGNLSKYRVIIAIAGQDLYNNKRPEKDFLFSVGTQSQQGYRLGVVSLKRLNPAFYQKKPDSRVTEARLRKLLLKQIGRFYYAKPGSSNPSSVMYDGINSVEDVDRMGEGF